MPTFNQLVRNGRQDKTFKSAAPALLRSLNTLKKEQVDRTAPRREAFARLSRPLPRKSPTRLFVR